MQQIMTNGNMSKSFIPYLSQFRATYKRAWRSVKKRIESKVSQKSTQEIDPHNIVEISTEGEVETVTPANSLSDETISINLENNEKPEIYQYWEITNGKDSLYHTLLRRISLWCSFSNRIVEVTLIGWIM